MNRFNPYGYEPAVFTEFVPWEELEIGTLYKHKLGGQTLYVVYKKELPNDFKSFELPGVEPPFSRIMRRKGSGAEGIFYRRPREPLKARHHALAAFGRPSAADTRRSRRRRARTSRRSRRA